MCIHVHSISYLNQRNKKCQAILNKSQIIKYFALFSILQTKSEYCQATYVMLPLMFPDVLLPAPAPPHGPVIVNPPRLLPGPAPTQPPPGADPAPVQPPPLLRDSNYQSTHNLNCCLILPSPASSLGCPLTTSPLGHRTNHP